MGLPQIGEGLINVSGHLTMVTNQKETKIVLKVIESVYELGKSVVGNAKFRVTDTLEWVNMVGVAVGGCCRTSLQEPIRQKNAIQGEAACVLCVASETELTEKLNAENTPTVACRDRVCEMNADSSQLPRTVGGGKKCHVLTRYPNNTTIVITCRQAD
ncbi:hypothetical protein TPHA_0I02870 [Tetrapisispora phaffii CBS 4417]|uniref:Uncharacterized protein n=1 Tax=Tetrapisispora phaffii (strain ATCC 24235 / CBS 4417 / NBRC 1672 / NRRL Y-8282 / UCD 70-5) TaxID=1071381 RepID=G8BY10_TETPH|nr:hypothetical protein TPHA_0I02870 [Tetrapisispora phaffii CBS 4417]CCE64788.1 hypothetical protein TPHA_0I02870 [Tetrapisispora phaffii CBS 4417]